MDHERKEATPELRNDENEINEDDDTNSCHILQIPELVMTNVFKLLDTNDRYNTMQVCHLWDNIMNETVGIPAYIGLRPQFSFPHLLERIQWYPMDKLSHTFGVDRCIVGDLSNLLDTDSSKLPSFWNPNIVDLIGFYGEISHDCFCKLTDRLRFLSHLTLHLVVFMNVDFTKFQMIKKDVKILCILFTHAPADMNWTMTGPQEDFAHRSLMEFLKKSSCFPRLSTFTIRFPYPKEKMDELCYATAIFCKRHYGSLKDFTFHTPYDFPSHPNADNSLSSQFSLTNELKQQNFWGEDVQMKKIVILPSPFLLEASGNRIPEQMENKIRNKLWTSLILNQKKLKRVQYENSDESWSFPLPIFLNNETTLTCVYITVNATLMIDCSAIEKCRRLLRLTLLAGYEFRLNNAHLDFDGNSIPVPEEGDLELQQPKPQFINAHKLPSSLEDLEILGVLISTDELEGMFAKGSLRNLKYLSLTKITYNLPSCGLTFDVLNGIFRDYQVVSLSLSNAFNSQDVVETFKSLRGGVKSENVELLRRVLSFMDNQGKEPDYYLKNPHLLRFESHHF